MIQGKCIPYVKRESFVPNRKTVRLPISVREPLDFGGGGGLTFLPIKKMPESVRVEIGMQTQTFTISNQMKLLSLEK